MALRIPKQYSNGLAKFLKLSDEQADRLLVALEQSPVSEDPIETLKENLSALGTLAESDVESIAEAVVSLFAVGTHSDQSTTELVDDFVDAIRASGSEELRFSTDAEPAIRSRLTRLLNAETFSLSAKARSHLYEYDRVFSKAHITTDVRPIFGADPEEPPKAAVLTHMLSIHYFHDGQHKEFFVALDEHDLDSLGEVLERANSKAESLKTVLETANLTYIGP